MAAAQHQDKEPDQGKDHYVLFYQGQFFDTAMEAVDPATMPADARRVVVAVSPALSIQDSLRVKARINARRTVVTVLSEQWIQRLQEQLP